MQLSFSRYATENSTTFILLQINILKKNNLFFRNWVKRWLLTQETWKDCSPWPLANSVFLWILKRRWIYDYSIFLETINLFRWLSWWPHWMRRNEWHLFRHELFQWHCRIAPPSLPRHFFISCCSHTFLPHNFIYFNNSSHSRSSIKNPDNQCKGYTEQW